MRRDERPGQRHWMPADDTGHRRWPLRAGFTRLHIMTGERDNNTNAVAQRRSTELIEHPVWAALLALLALAFGYLGVGLPQHYYQPLFAALTLALIWRHGIVELPPSGWRWPLAVLYFLVLCLMYKLLIGGGIDTPFSWLKVPTLQFGSHPENAPWYQHVVPTLNIQLTGIANISDWQLDITKIQTLLLITTLIGAMLRFQPFASLTALALLIVSLPTFVRFNWDWVLMFLICGAAAFYMQSGAAHAADCRRAKRAAGD